MALAVMATACSSGTSSTPSTTHARGSTTSTTASSHKLPGIHHVFVIMLENEGYSSTFGNPSADPYLATTLPSKGALLQNYYGIGHLSNDNYIAFVSGQAPNPSNQADCPTFANFPATATVAGNGQISGSGCVFPTSVPTVANQLTTSGLTWKGYMEDMGNVPTRESANCGHPAVGSTDDRPRRRASRKIAPSERTTRRIISGDRPSSRRRSAKAFTDGAFRSASFLAPINE